jgi:hypothetical protein
MAKELLNGAQMDAMLEQVGGVGMPQRMNGDVLRQPARPGGRGQRLLDIGSA